MPSEGTPISGAGSKGSLAKAPPSNAVSQARHRLRFGQVDWLGAIFGRATDQGGLEELTLMELHIGDPAALSSVDARQVGPVPMQVEGTHPLAERVLGSHSTEPAVVRARTGRRHHLSERIGCIDPRTPGADHLAVLEPAERKPRAAPVAGSVR